MNQEEVITFEDFQAACAGKSHAAMTALAWDWMEEAHNVGGAYNEMEELCAAVYNALDYVIDFLEERNLLSEIDSKGFALYKTVREENRAKMVKRIADNIERLRVRSVENDRIERTKIARQARAKKDPKEAFIQNIAKKKWQERHEKEGFVAVQFAREMHELSIEMAPKRQGEPNKRYIVQPETIQKWTPKWAKECKKTT
ncbi:MAG: hypothetical protein LBQ75_02700 [Zoogloeaceae bacterium]|nr:hypothetical protein [Zoogloeaceae bacterium]